MVICCYPATKILLILDLFQARKQDNSIIPGSQALAVNIPINTTVFAACNSSEFDIGFLPSEISCVNWYRLTVGVMGLIGTVLSCFLGKEQIYVRVILSIIRIIVMCYMMGFSIFVMSEDRKGIILLVV